MIGTKTCRGQKVARTAMGRTRRATTADRNPAKKLKTLVSDDALHGKPENRPEQEIQKGLEGSYQQAESVSML